MHTFPLGKFNGANENAEYRILLIRGKIAKLVKLGGPDIPGIKKRMKKAGVMLPFPLGSKALLVRNAAVTCYGGKCELVIEP